MDEDDEPFELVPDEVKDVLLIDALMGWDGDACGCIECACRRFIDEADEQRCRDCRAGRHWPSEEGGQDA